MSTTPRALLCCVVTFACALGAGSITLFVYAIIYLSDDAMKVLSNSCVSSSLWGFLLAALIAGAVVGCCVRKKDENNKPHPVSACSFLVWLGFGIWGVIECYKIADNASSPACVALRQTGLWTVSAIYACIFLVSGALPVLVIACVLVLTGCVKLGCVKPGLLAASSSSNTDAADGATGVSARVRRASKLLHVGAYDSIRKLKLKISGNEDELPVAAAQTGAVMTRQPSSLADIELEVAVELPTASPVVVAESAVQPPAALAESRSLPRQASLDIA